MGPPSGARLVAEHVMYCFIFISFVSHTLSPATFLRLP